MKKGIKLAAILIGSFGLLTTAIVAPIAVLSSQSYDKKIINDADTFKTIDVNPKFIELATNITLRKEFEKIVWPDSNGPVLFAFDDTNYQLPLIERNIKLLTTTPTAQFENKLVNGIPAINYIPFTFKDKSFIESKELVSKAVFKDWGKNAYLIDEGKKYQYSIEMYGDFLTDESTNLLTLENWNLNVHRWEKLIGAFYENNDDALLEPDFWGAPNIEEYKNKKELVLNLSDNNLKDEIKTPLEFKIISQKLPDGYDVLDTSSFSVGLYFELVSFEIDGKKIPEEYSRTRIYHSFLLNELVNEMVFKNGGILETCEYPRLYPNIISASKGTKPLGTPDIFEINHRVDFKTAPIQPFNDQWYGLDQTLDITYDGLKFPVSNVSPRIHGVLEYSDFKEEYISHYGKDFKLAFEKDNAVKDFVKMIDATIKEGQHHVIHGVNGKGKTEEEYNYIELLNNLGIDQFHNDNNEHHWKEEDNFFRTTFDKWYWENITKKTDYNEIIKEVSLIEDKSEQWISFTFDTKPISKLVNNLNLNKYIVLLTNATSSWTPLGDGVYSYSAGFNYEGEKRYNNIVGNPNYRIPPTSIWFNGINGWQKK